jgi:hypothetical protein
MAPPAKTLREHVRDGTFRPSRHAHLLDSEDLPETTPKPLRDLQRIYRYLHWSPRVRAALAVEFAETIVRARDPLWQLGQLAASKHLTSGPAVRLSRR